MAVIVIDHHEQYTRKPNVIYGIPLGNITHLLDGAKDGWCLQRVQIC